MPADILPFNRDKARAASMAAMSDSALEQELLGTLLLKPSLLSFLPCWFSSDHYVHPQHARVHLAICERSVSGAQVLLSVTEALRGEPGLDAAYLAALVRCVTSSTQGAPDHVVLLAQHITDRHRRRRIVTIAGRLGEEACKGDLAFPIDAVIARGRAGLDALSLDEQDHGCIMFDDALDTSIRNTRANIARGGHGGVHIPGFSVLNSMVAMLPKQVTILGGLPGSGKSAIGFAWAVSVAKQIREDVDAGRVKLSDVGGVIALSMEMEADSLADRVLSAAAGVPLLDMIHGHVAPEGMLAIESAHKLLLRLPCVVIAVGGLTREAIMARLREASKRLGGKVCLIVGDHAQSIDPGEKSGDNLGVTTRIVANLVVEIAKTFNAHVIMLSHLKRGHGGMDPDRPPNMSDLWGGRLLEATGDNVILLHRPEISMSETPPVQREDEPSDGHEMRVEKWRQRREKYRGKAYLILDKVRAGKPGKVDLAFDGPTASFREEDYQS